MATLEPTEDVAYIMRYFLACWAILVSILPVELPVLPFAVFPALILAGKKEWECVNWYPVA